MNGTAAMLSTTHAGSGATQNSESANHVDGSVSAAHWTHVPGLSTVAEHPALARKQVQSIRTLGPAEMTTSVAGVVRYASSSANGSSMISAGDAPRAPKHDRNASTVSAVSSVGPSAEYEEEELDEEWLQLIKEVNELLQSKGKPPIASAKCAPPSSSHSFV